MTKIHLHIENLSLPGYTPAERRALVAALERELVTSLASTGGRQDQATRKQEVLRVTSHDLHPQSVAHGAIAGLSLGTRKERQK